MPLGVIVGIFMAIPLSFLVVFMVLSLFLGFARIIIGDGWDCYYAYVNVPFALYM